MRICGQEGVMPFAVDVGDLDIVAATVQKRQPKIIFLETISNGTMMEILDVQEFLKLPELHNVNPLIILDNTLPTDSNLPLARLIRESGLRVIGVESGTKSYAMNQDLAGIVYTYDEELLNKLERKRRRGDHPGKSQVKNLSSVIPPTKEQFDRENRIIAANTAMLAKACWESIQSEPIDLIHHNLPDHPQSNLARKLYPEGASPVFFIVPRFQWDSERATSSETVASSLQSALLRNGLRPNIDFYISQSFGFNKTGILHDREGRYLRVAGGLENPEQMAKLQVAFQEGLAASHK